MGKPQVCKIYIIGGRPDNLKAHAKHADVIVWIPETANDLIDITFVDKSPFGTTRLVADNKGDAVGAFVVADPRENTDYLYTCTTNGIHLEAEPEIIVDGGGGSGEPKGNKSGGKAKDGTTKGAKAHRSKNGVAKKKAPKKR